MKEKNLKFILTIFIHQIVMDNISEVSSPWSHLLDWLLLELFCWDLGESEDQLNKELPPSFVHFMICSFCAYVGVIKKILLEGKQRHILHK